MKKLLLLIAAIGNFSVIFSAQAVSVLSWELTDFDGDGRRSDFLFDFTGIPTGAGTNKFGYSGETGCINAPDGDHCVPIITDGRTYPTDAFTSGFDFGGLGYFKPNLEIPGGIVADITNNILTFTTLNWAGRFPGPTGNQFFIPPNNKVLAGFDPITGQQIISGEINTDFAIVETLQDLGGGRYGVVVRWNGRVLNASGGIDAAYAGFTANWRVEGIMSTVPVPAAAWLFASGLLGLIGLGRRSKTRV